MSNKDLPQYKRNRKAALGVALSGVIAALYVVLALPLSQFSFGPIQFRPSEVLSVLPAFTPYAIPGVVIGCFLSNLLNPGALGPIDIIGGTLATLAAALFTALIGRKSKVMGIIPPILINGIVVGGYLTFLLAGDGEITAAAVVTNMISVGGSEALVLTVLGIPLIFLLKKTSFGDRFN